MRRPLKVILYGLVMAVMLGGAAGWVYLDKTVTLRVDGVAKKIDTYAGRVQGVLDKEDMELGDHDTVSPGPGARFADGDTIEVRHGKLVTVIVDGESSQRWMTANSVGEAVDQLGYELGDVYVSDKADKRIPINGFSMTIRTPKRVVLIVDGERREESSTAATVGEFLREQGVEMSEDDLLSEAASSPLTDRMELRVSRVSLDTVVERQTIDYEVVRHDDPDLAQGIEQVDQAGVEGVKEVTYQVTYVDGKADTKEPISSKIITEPVDKVVRVGTKPPPEDTGEPGPAGHNWDAVAECESGGDWHINTGNGYYGGLQFNLPTWESNGGTQYAARPDLASREQQIEIAEKLWAARGTSPWPVCGSRLYT